MPGPTATDMAGEHLGHFSGGEVVRSLTGAAGEERIKSILPLGRMGTPADIARVVAFLVSEEGGWITGQAIKATGGAGLGGW